MEIGNNINYKIKNTTSSVNYLKEETPVTNEKSEFREKTEIIKSDNNLSENLSCAISNLLIKYQEQGCSKEEITDILHLNNIPFTIENNNITFSAAGHTYKLNFYTSESDKTQSDIQNIYNQAGTIQEIHEFSYNDDGSYTVVIKNPKGEIISTNSYDKNGDLCKKEYSFNASFIDGQVFTLEELYSNGFKQDDITNYFNIVQGNDGKTYYQVKTSNIYGNLSQSIEGFFIDVMQEKIRQIELKFQAGAIKFSEIEIELKKLGISDITKTKDSSGNSTIQISYGEYGNTTIENTAKTDAIREYAGYMSGKIDFEQLAKNIDEKIIGATDVKLQTNDDGLQILTFNVDNEIVTYVGRKNTKQEEEPEKIRDDNEYDKNYLHHMGFNQEEIDKYFIKVNSSEENDDETFYKLKFDIKINDKEINTLFELQREVVFNRLKQGK